MNCTQHFSQSYTVNAWWQNFITTSEYGNEIFKRISLKQTFCGSDWEYSRKGWLGLLANIAKVVVIFLFCTFASSFRKNAKIYFCEDTYGNTRTKFIVSTTVWRNKLLRLQTLPVLIYCMSVGLEVPGTRICHFWSWNALYCVLSVSLE